MDVNTRLRASNPVYTGESDIVELAPNSVAGTAEDLLAEVSANGASISDLVGLEIHNTALVTMYLRTATLGAATSGAGIPIPPGMSHYVPLHSGSINHPLLYELGGAVDAHVTTFYGR